MDEKCVLGIDLSLNGTGIAVVNSSLELVETRLVKLNGNMDTPQLKGMERAIYILNVIKDFVERHKPEAVIIEGYSFGSKGRSVFDLGEVGGIVRYELSRYGLTYYEVPPTTLKKYVSQNGHAKKEEMQKAVTERYGHVLESHDINDAFCLCAMFLELSLPEFLNQIGERIKNKKASKKRRSKTVEK